MIFGFVCLFPVLISPGKKIFLDFCVYCLTHVHVVWQFVHLIRYLLCYIFFCCLVWTVVYYFIFKLICVSFRFHCYNSCTLVNTLSLSYNNSRIEFHSDLQLILAILFMSFDIQHPIFCYYMAFQSLDFWVYLMKFIPETCSAHWMRYLRFY